MKVSPRGNNESSSLNVNIAFITLLPSSWQVHREDKSVDLAEEAKLSCRDFTWVNPTGSGGRTRPEVGNALSPPSLCSGLPDAVSS